MWRKLRQWIFDAGVAQGLVPIGTVADVEFTVEVVYPNNQNALYNDATRINLRLAALGFVGAVITSVNAVGPVLASAWGPLLGLYQSSASLFAFVFSGGAWRLDGQFQPRGLSVLLRSEQDSDEYEERQDYRTMVLGSGQVVPCNYGFAEVRRDLRLVSLHPFELAPQFHLGTLLSIDVTRTVLSFPNPTRTGAGGSGVLGIGSVDPGIQTDRVSPGDIVRVSEQWVARVRSITIPAPPTPVTIALWEVIPSNIVPPVGAPIYKVSDFHALLLESLRLGGLFVYDVDDTSGEWRASGPLYHLRGEGKLLLQFDRQQPQAADRYAFTIGLTRSSAPGLVVVS